MSRGLNIDKIVKTLPKINTPSEAFFWLYFSLINFSVHFKRLEIITLYKIQRINTSEKIMKLFAFLYCALCPADQNRPRPLSHARAVQLGLAVERRSARQVSWAWISQSQRPRRRIGQTIQQRWSLRPTRSRSSDVIGWLSARIGRYNRVCFL